MSSRYLSSSHWFIWRSRNWCQWKYDACCIRRVAGFVLAKILSHVARSLRPNPCWKRGWLRSWQRQLWAWPWNALTTSCNERVHALSPRELALTVTLWEQPISYPMAWFGPKTSRISFSVASPYFALYQITQDGYKKSAIILTASALKSGPVSVFLPF